MKYLLPVLIIFNLQGCAKEMKKSQEHKKVTTKKQFQAVWDIVQSNPYKELPQNQVSFNKLFTWHKNIILEDAKRTLSNRADILPSFEKLAHPNGICLKGTWNIEKENPFSGYFKQGSQALIIARASSAMSNTKQGEIRAFGLAGKLFPTTNPSKINSQPSANFFVIDDLGGTEAKNFTDVALTNTPPLTTNIELLKHIAYGLKVNSAFKEADKNPSRRQLYEISELGEKGAIKTPKWIRVKAQSSINKNSKDFRDELKINGSKKLIFTIEVAEKKRENKKVWQKIGTITFDKSVTSYACDQQLHFHHPKWIE
jgi:hypothetical protein